MRLGLLKGLILYLSITVTACGAKQGIITETWFTFDNYSIEIDAGDDETRVSVLPSLWILFEDSVFKGDMKLVLHYPSTEERIDLAVISIFSPNQPRADLPQVKVKTSYMILDELVEEQTLDNPVFAEGEWTKLGEYKLKPGGEEKVKIPGAAGHKLVVIRSEIYDKDGEELLSRYLHGFEIE